MNWRMACHKAPLIGVVLVCGLVAWGQLSAGPADADDVPPTSAVLGDTGPGVTLDPAKLDWLAMEAQDRADGEALLSDPAARASVLAEKARLADETGRQVANKSARTPLLSETCGVGPLFDAPPMPAEQFLSTGGVVQIIGDECVAVYVGQLGFDRPDQGAVYVLRTTADGTSSADLSDIPGSGALTLADTSEGFLTMSSESGQRFTLDTAHKQTMPVRA